MLNQALQNLWAGSSRTQGGADQNLLGEHLHSRREVGQRPWQAGEGGGEKAQRLTFKAYLSEVRFPLFSLSQRQVTAGLPPASRAGVSAAQGT